MTSTDLRWAWRFIAPYWRRLVLVLGLSLLGTALSLYLPYLSKALVDRALLGRSMTELIRIVSLFAGFTLASFAMNVISGLRYTRVSADILFDMRLALYRHLQRLSPRFYADTPLGQIVSRINTDIGEIQRVAAEAALAWVGNVLFLAGTVAMLIWLDLRLFLVSIAFLPPAVWALVRYRRRLEGAVATLRESSAGIGTFLIETLLGMKHVVAANAQAREVDRFRNHNDGFIRHLMAMRRLTYLAGGFPGLLLSTSTAVVFLYGGSRVINGSITMGTLVAFIAYQMRVLSPIQGLMGLYASLATARVSLQRVRQIVDTPVEVVESVTPIALPTARGEIAFDRVSFTFAGRDAVLDEVSLLVHPGEIVAIVGPSGVGKSTLADLLVRHLDPDRGRIVLDGHDLRELRLVDLRRHVIAVSQDPFVFNVSMGENIAYGRPDATAEDIWAAAAAAGLSGLLDRLPAGLDTPVGERGRALSAGERQRVAIARAFLADPSVLILDEATAALDPETERQVVGGYEAIMHGRTTIIISHRFDLATRAHRVVVLDRGQIAEQGPPDELLARRGPFHRMFDTADRM